MCIYHEIIMKLLLAKVRTSNHAQEVFCSELGRACSERCKGIEEYFCFF